MTPTASGSWPTSWLPWPRSRRSSPRWGTTTTTTGTARSRPGCRTAISCSGEEFARVGIELLVDRGRAVAPRGGAGELEVLGLDDFWRRQFDPAAAFRSLPGTGDAGRVRIVLGHNPDAYAAIQDQRFELALFGHTHGGQISLPLFGAPYVPCEDPRFVSGLVETGRHLVYTNRGLGYNRRVRFGVRPEITHFTLLPA